MPRTIPPPPPVIDTTPINPHFSLILMNAASTFKSKQGDSSEDLRTQNTIQTLFKHLGLLSPKDGKSVLTFAARPVRMERDQTPEKARGREKGILIQLTGEKDVRKLLRAWGKLPKYTEHRTLIRYPIEKPHDASAEADQLDEDDSKQAPAETLAGSKSENAKTLDDDLDLNPEAPEEEAQQTDEADDDLDGEEDSEDGVENRKKVVLQRHSKKILRKK